MGAHLGIVEKRGANLCAPVPKPLGFTGYLNEMSEEMLSQRMREYKEIVSKYPRGGRGVEELCTESRVKTKQFWFFCFPLFAASGLGGSGDRFFAFQDWKPPI